MTMRTLLQSSFLGGVLAAVIVAATGFLIRGGLTPHRVVAALLIGVGSGMGIFFAFVRKLDKRNC